MIVIITGSLGNTGKPLAEDLIQKGHDVTVISSKKEKQKDIEALGATAAIGSLEDVAFLTETFTGADAVYVMVPPDLTVPDSIEYYRRIGNNYAKAIQQSGVKRVVHLSSIGAELNKGTGFILGSHEVETILDKLPGIAVTHVRAGYFYSNLYGFTDMIKGAGFIGANYGGDDKIIMAHPKDIAAAVAEEILTQVSANQVRFIVSDDHTADEAAKIIGKAIGKPDLKWLTLTNEQVQEGMSKAGLPPQAVAMFVEMGESVHSGAIRKEYDKQQQAPTGNIKLEDFANEFAKSF